MATKELPPPLSEKKFMQAIVEAARLRRWLVYHTFDSRKSNPGFPDLVLVRGERLVFAELKGMKGKVTAEQNEWLDNLSDVRETNPGVEVYLWRPSDWEEIDDVLR